MNGAAAPPSLGDLLAQARGRLAAGGVDEAALDARLLLQVAAGIEHAALIAGMREPAREGVAARLDGFLERRLAGEPVSRIRGAKPFRGLELCVTPDVLDPRPETEILIDSVLAELPDRDRQYRFCDIGTGSGAIAIALLDEYRQAYCVAVDISDAALKVARENARKCGVDTRMEFHRGRYLDEFGGPFDAIVSNPPYITSAEIAGLEREVRDHDPALALDGGEDGLDAYRAIAAQAPSRLLAGGSLHLETGAGQAEAVRGLLARAGFEALAGLRDLAGIERVVAGRLPAA
jgi:release factor glutamine methyltransferase